MRRFAWLLSLAVLVLTPSVASACPVCFNAREEARIAYLATTGFLSLLPLAMAGAVVVYIRGRARALRELEMEPAPVPDRPESP